MKKTFLIFALIAGACGVAVFSATSSFQAFFSGKPTPIHPIVVQNEIYLPLAEVASLFHLKAEVDLAAKHIFLEPALIPTAASPKLNSDTTPENAILGKIETEVSPVKVSLFRGNEKYPESMERHAVELWISKNDSFYADTHGKVTDTVSDPQGRFAFSKIPPGDYEILAFRPMSSRQMGYWLIRIRIAKGQVKELSLDSHNLNQLKL